MLAHRLQNSLVEAAVVDAKGSNFYSLCPVVRERNTVEFVEMNGVAKEWGSKTERADKSADFVPSNQNKIKNLGVFFSKGNPRTSDMIGRAFNI